MTENRAETHELFRHRRVASGYAMSRPYLHPDVFARVRALLPRDEPFARALDVGCGTGMSSVALLALASEVIGVDASREMLRESRRQAGVRYVACTAETIPFADGAFDLVVACGSMDWIDRQQFMPRASRLVAPGGWLVSLDFGDTGRSPDVPRLAGWYDTVFQGRYPRPPARDPMLTAEEATPHGFEAPLHLEFAMPCAFTPRGYAAFLMTESNVVAAVEYGSEREDGVRRWLEREIQPLFEDQAHWLTFAGYIQALRRR